jgi:hypothetical protein
VSKKNGKDGEKGHHLTKKLMNTSAGADEVGGGQKHRISAGGGDGEVVLAVDFELCLLRSLVDEM